MDSSRSVTYLQKHDPATGINVILTESGDHTVVSVFDIPVAAVLLACLGGYCILLYLRFKASVS